MLLWFLSVSQIDLHFMKKIPPGAEASNVLVGELEFLDRPVVAFIRLAPAVLLNGLAEVPITTRLYASCSEKLPLCTSLYSVSSLCSWADDSLNASLEKDLNYTPQKTVVLCVAQVSFHLARPSWKRSTVSWNWPVHCYPDDWWGEAYVECYQGSNSSSRGSIHMF